MASKFVCGYDFGTLSCRLLVVSLETGEAVFEKSMDYPHGVIGGSLPESGVPLGADWYLQDPADYLSVMAALTREAVRAVPPEDIAAIGTDFTNCTVVALDGEGRPLCLREKFRDRPHAWVKLWKHHAAQPWAARMEAALETAGFPWYREYGRNVSSEWFFPKVLQVYEEDREVFDAAQVFLEAADYIPLALTGRLTRNSATLGVNAFYDSRRGFPPEQFLDGLSPGFGRAVLPKLAGEILPVGSPAGRLTQEAAELLSLRPGTVVAVGHGDSEVAAAGLGITEPGSMLMVMGTSTCHQLMGEGKTAFDGVCAIVEDGMIPGLTAYESGQPAVGDAFAWFADNMVPARYEEEARQEGLPLLAYLDRLAGKLRPGQTGLVALDWFNGNRSVLMNYHLTGLVAGLSLATKPEHIYRALLEATAFGARKIFDGYEAAGVPIRKVYASGGLARKSPVTMQIYADILGREVTVTSLPNASAMGACVCGAVALGGRRACRKDFQEAAGRIVRYDTAVYAPDQKAAKVCGQLYQVFCRLHDFAGMESDVCAELRRLREPAAGL